MTDVEIRMAIADACGRDTSATKQALVHFKDRDGYPDAILQLAGIPDYCNDLNAMHEAEKTLGNESLDYDKALDTVFFRGARTCDWSSYPNDFTWHATARQRAEAFMEIIGKRRES